jgi:hypothetical protein
MIDKNALLENMVVLADTLDEMGLKKEAEVVDGMIAKVAGGGDAVTNMINQNKETPSKKIPPLSSKPVGWTKERWNDYMARFRGAEMQSPICLNDTPYDRFRCQNPPSAGSMQQGGIQSPIYYPYYDEEVKKYKEKYGVED